LSRIYGSARRAGKNAHTRLFARFAVCRVQNAAHDAQPMFMFPDADERARRYSV
jgi:hypothetical protein